MSAACDASSIEITRLGLTRAGAVIDAFTFLCSNFIAPRIRGMRETRPQLCTTKTRTKLFVMIIDESNI
jgi:hypothetical protein